MTNDLIRKNLGAKIRGMREQQGMSQRVFALMIGLDRTYLIAVEHGRRNIAIDNLAKISAGLGVTLSHLFEGVDSGVDLAEDDKHTKI